MTTIRKLALMVEDTKVTLTIGENKLERTYMTANEAAQAYSGFEQDVKKLLTCGM